MYWEWQYKFEHEAPSAEQLLARLQENTGMADIILNENRGFEHPIFNKQVFYIIRTDHCVKVILIARDRSWYLLEAFFATLEDFGGVCEDFRAEAWGRHKWKDVEKLHIKGELYRMLGR